MTATSPKLFAVALAVLITPAVWGDGDFDQGFTAYNRGDYQEAMKWYRKAAEIGDAMAQFMLGAMYDSGQGTPENREEAIKWYRLAARQGVSPAQFNLGVMYGEGQGVPRDYVIAHMWYNLAAAQGNENARQNRDAIANLMTPAQLDDARRLVREWLEMHKN